MLYSRAEEHYDSMLLIKTRNGNIFGSYNTEPWVMTKPRDYYGTGECFLFNVENNELKVHKWSKKDNFIMNSSSSHLGMGGGIKGFAFCLDEDLDNGSASECQTFDLNHPIIPENDFRVAELELITFYSTTRRASIDILSPRSKPRKQSLFAN